MAQKAQTTEPYLEKLAGGFALPSLRMATRIARAVPGKLITQDSFIVDFERRHGAI